uniref:Uncharacterized protein n=1 Tax=Cyprinodon variegatus TaxID=28743 RepID=A0A3Q2FHW1_CYPVA
LFELKKLLGWEAKCLQTWRQSPVLCFFTFFGMTMTGVTENLHRHRCKGIIIFSFRWS